MVLGTGDRQYAVVREVFSGKANDVYVCTGLSGPDRGEYHTVWLIKDRALARHLVRALEAKAGCFMEKDKICFVLPYGQERPLGRFYCATVKSGNGKPCGIWLNIVTLCMTCGLCDSLVYLMLSQGQVRLSEDGGTDFQYFADLTDYDAGKSARDSVRKCAELLLFLMEQTQELEGGSGDVAELIRKRYRRGEYREYIQLYKDIKLLGKKKDKVRFSQLAKKTLAQKRDFIYKALAAACVLLAVAAGMLLIGRLVLGDFAFYRLFSGAIKQIGTESLLQ